MSRARTFPAIALFIALVVAPPVRAEEPFRYPEAVHGRGELKYVNGLPVLVLEGTPEELGEQAGALALKPAVGLTESADDFIKDRGWQQVYSIILNSGNVLLPQFPADHVKELDAAAEASGWHRNLLIFGITVYDLQRLIQCSTLIVEGERSATGEPLFGRNLDWPPFGRLHEYTLVVVYRPEGKHAYASITYPGMLGCPSGMNDAGLAIAALTASSTRDGSPRIDIRGIPTFLALRRVLEECTSVEEAADLLRPMRRASSLNLAVCDRHGGAVFEITPKSLVVRKPDEGICACTNHFRSAELATGRNCRRFDILETSRGLEKLTLADVAEKMHAVNQGPSTLQTMIFEPASLKLHLAFGEGPATRLPLRTLDLAVLFGSGHRPKAGR